MASGDDIGTWLEAARSGDGAATNRLIELLYPQLHNAASAMLKGERHVSMASGDLVHEVALKLIKLDSIEWQSRAHFLALASKLMRRVLVDHMRAKRANKRDHVQVTLHTHIQAAQPLDFNELHHALNRLSAIDEEGAGIVEMRYFGGMTIGDVASVMGMSEPTVKRRWSAARLWLVDAIGAAA